MPTYTPRYSLPIYDAATDPPDGPAQMRSIVERVEQVIYDRAQDQATQMITYTPAINFNVGTNVGYYKRVSGSNLVHAQFKQIVASGQFPTGAPMLTFGLPIAAANWEDIVGHGFVMRSGGLIPLIYAGIAPGAVGAWRQVVAGESVVANRIGGTTWGSWAAGDKFYASLTYRAAS